MHDEECQYYYCVPRRSTYKHGYFTFCVSIVCVAFQYIGPAIDAWLWVMESFCLESGTGEVDGGSYGKDYQHWSIYQIQWGWD